MASAIDRIQNGLSKLKSLGEDPSSLEDREKVIRQLKIDLTFLGNLPPSQNLDAKECILASKEKV